MGQSGRIDVQLQSELRFYAFGNVPDLVMIMRDPKQNMVKSTRNIRILHHANELRCHIASHTPFYGILHKRLQVSVGVIAAVPV